MTAILIQGVLSSLILVGLYSQSSMANVTIFLQGGLSVVWLISGFFFFIPLVIARKKYADRYASEDFWRIPGGMVGGLDRWSSSAWWRTCGGIYYSFASPWIADVPHGTWMTWVGSDRRRHVRPRRASSTSSAAARRTKLTQEDALAHLAVLDLTKIRVDEPRGGLTA